MTVTSQTNTTLEEIAEVLRDSDDFCICGHMNPDGDCVGSALTLSLALKQMGKNVVVLKPTRDALDANFDFLPGIDEVEYAGDFKGQCRVFVAVDAPDENRMGTAASAVFKRASTTITIDHHAVPERMSTYSYTDPDSASTTMLIWQLLDYLGVERTSDLATCAYMGLMTDTGRFIHQNTNAQAMQAAFEMVAAGASPSIVAAQFYQRRTLASILLEARVIERMKLLCSGQIVLSHITREDMNELGATKADCEPLIDVLRSIEGVRVCCILREQKEHIRGSFRAKDDTDVAELAAHFGGGGHKAAAGFTMHTTLTDARAQVEQILLDKVRDQ